MVLVVVAIICRSRAELTAVKLDVSSLSITEELETQNSNFGAELEMLLQQVTNLRSKLASN